MSGVRSLSSGLVIGLIVAATVFGALVLSVRGGQPAAISELPSPAVTLQVVITSLAPTFTPTRASTQAMAASLTASPTATPTTTPTICPIPPGWQRYSVGPFDTLISIAQRFSLTPDQLVQTNCLDKPSVTVGQTIYVPGFKPTPTNPPCFPPFNWVPYIVQPGDTLGSIAQRYNVSLYSLMRANCLTTTYIYYGQLLHVPPIYPIVTFTPTPIIPTFTPTPPLVSPTPTAPPSDTPTVIPTTPAITVTLGPTDTPGATDTPGPTETPAPTATPAPTSAPTNTPAPTVASTAGTPTPTSMPEPSPVVTTSP
jgi:LysM repeat protein